MDMPRKTPPSYAINSVDNALRVAAMLQLEGDLTVAEIADRIGVARSTAHRLLAMLVYRDFATQSDNRAYQAGPVLENPTHSQPQAATLRTTALPHLRHLSDHFGETVSLTIRTGRTARVLASAEKQQRFLAGSREGMVFPAQRTTGGLLLLAQLPDSEVEAMYPPYHPDLPRMRAELAIIRRNGFAVNRKGPGRGLVAVAVPVRDPEGPAIAGLSVCTQRLESDEHQLRRVVNTLLAGAHSLEMSWARASLCLAEHEPVDHHLAIGSHGPRSELDKVG